MGFDRISLNVVDEAGKKNSRRALEQGRQDPKLLEVLAEIEQLKVDFSAASADGHVAASIDVECANESSEVVHLSEEILGILDGVASGVLGRLEGTEEERRLPDADERDAVEGGVRQGIVLDSTR